MKISILSVFNRGDTVIPYGRQDIQQCDIDAVIATLKSPMITQGNTLPLFEQAVANYCQANHAIAVNSATSALHIACLALGLEYGDWLWTSAITFVASANCALYCGARVDFVDIDPETYNLCPLALESMLIVAKQANRLPKIVVPVHLTGQSCDMQRIHQLSREYGFKIIEDASHAIGGGYSNANIGSCLYSDITVFSFHPVKIITTGEGGMALTNDSQLAAQMSLLRSHGIIRDPTQMTHTPDGSWYYQQVSLGYNYRMTDIAAALGLSQLDRLDEYVSKRQQIAARYNLALSKAGLPLKLPYQLDNTYSAYHLYVIRLQLSQLSLTHKDVFDRLREVDIGVNVHYIPVHLQPYYQQQFGFKAGDFPHAEQYYAEAISLPMYPTLKDAEQDYVIEQLIQVLS